MVRSFKCKKQRVDNALSRAENIKTTELAELNGILSTRPTHIAKATRETYLRGLVGDEKHAKDVYEKLCKVKTLNRGTANKIHKMIFNYYNMSHSKPIYTALISDAARQIANLDINNHPSHAFYNGNKVNCKSRNSNTPHTYYSPITGENKPIIHCFKHLPDFQLQSIIGVPVNTPNQQRRVNNKSKVIVPKTANEILNNKLGKFLS